MGFKARNTSIYSVIEANSAIAKDLMWAIRKRPGMYIGGTDARGLHHMLWEVLANALDEAIAGRSDEIAIVLHNDDSFSVTDTGRGIPLHDVDGIPFAERAFTETHFSATFDGHTPHAHIGLFGVGLAVVSALSEFVEVETRRDGGRWMLRLEGGRLTTHLTRTGNCSDTGTTVRVKPDSEIFSSTTLSYETIRTRLVELAALLTCLRFRLRDERHPIGLVHSPEGIVTFLNSAPQGQGLYGPRLLTSPLTVKTKTAGCTIDAAIDWCWGPDAHIESFVNIQRTPGHGKHVDGLLLGLRDLRKWVLGERQAGQALVDHGLLAALHVTITDPLAFANPTKDRLADPDVSHDVRSAVFEVAQARLQAEPAMLESLARRWSA